MGGAVGRGVSTERAIASLEMQARFWEERAQQMREAVEAMRRQLREAERGGRRGGRRPGRPPGRGRRAGKGPGVGAVATEILKEWGRSARVREILPELEKRGVHVGGKNPMATLASTLLKYSGVKRAGRGLFVALGGASRAAGAGSGARKRKASGKGQRRPSRSTAPARSAAKPGAEEAAQSSAAS